MSSLFRDITSLIGALLGGAKDVALIGAEEYLLLLRKAVWPTFFLIAVGSTLVLISELSGVSLFNALAFLALATAMLIWLLLALPIIGIVNVASSIEWAPVRKTISFASTVTFVAIVVLVLAARFPAGWDGVQWIGIMLILFAGLSFFGMKLSKQFLAMQLIGAGLFAAIGLLVPQQISEGLNDLASDTFNEIGWSLSGEPQEIELTLALFDGATSGQGVLFDRDGDPRAWCREDSTRDAGVRCFSNAGRDPFSGERLTPITPKLASQIAVQLAQSAEDREREAQEAQRIEEAERDARALAAKLQEEERIKNAADAQRRAEQEQQIAEQERISQAQSQYRSANLLANNQRTDLAIHVLDQSRFNTKVQRDIAERLNEQAGTVFSNSAIRSGAFENVYSGDVDEIELLNLKDRTRRLILAKVQRFFTENDVMAGSGTASISVDIVGLETTENAIVWQQSVLVEARGQNRQIAEDLAERDLVPAIAKVIAANE